MNQSERATMQAALDAIEFYLNEIGLKEGNDPHYAPEDYSALETTARLRAALAQPEQEPVRIVGTMPGTNNGFTMACFKASDVPAGTAIYTHPVSAGTKPLTDEQDYALCDAFYNEAASEYFKARPQLESDVNRRIFYVGHRKAWVRYEAAHTLAGRSQYTAIKASK